MLLLIPGRAAVLACFCRRQGSADNGKGTLGRQFKPHRNTGFNLLERQIFDLDRFLLPPLLAAVCWGLLRTYVLMKTTVEGSVGAPAAVKRRRRDAPGRRRSGGVRVRRRVQVDATTAPAPLQRLLAACRRAFGGPGTVPSPDDVALIRDILDKMGAEDVHLRAVIKAAAASFPRTHPNPIITRTTIYKCKNFSIVIFLLPPGAVIPLHDHPGMTVFSKLLLGSLHVTSYDWVDAEDGPPTAVGGGGDRLLRLAKRVVDADLRAPCDALVLFPESGGNMHRFAAATACAVLDVLGPPYSGDRDCTYYQDLPYRHHHHDDDADEAAGDGDVVPAATDDEQKPRLGWLLETHKPKELHMYELPYRGPPIL